MPVTLRGRRVYLIALPCAALLVVAAFGVLRGANHVGAPSAADTTLCALELRSWVVAARGRHLYLDCDCPPPFEHLSGRIEFTSASLRTDYDAGAAAALVAANHEWLPRIARMSRDALLVPPPFVTDPQDRLEQGYRVPASIVRILQEDRLFAAPYRLLGPNSNSAIRAALELAGIPIPGRVLASGGMLGDFPGIAQSPGPLLPPSQWPNAALPGGPMPIPSAD